MSVRAAVAEIVNSCPLDSRMALYRGISEHCKNGAVSFFENVTDILLNVEKVYTNCLERLESKEFELADWHKRRAIQIIDYAKGNLDIARNLHAELLEEIEKTRSVIKDTFLDCRENKNSLVNDGIVYALMAGRIYQLDGEIQKLQTQTLAIEIKKEKEPLHEKVIDDLVALEPGTPYYKAIVKNDELVIDSLYVKTIMDVIHKDEVFETAMPIFNNNVDDLMEIWSKTLSSSEDLLKRVKEAKRSMEIEHRDLLETPALQEGMKILQKGESQLEKIIAEAARELGKRNNMKMGVRLHVCRAS